MVFFLRLLTKRSKVNQSTLRATKEEIFKRLDRFWYKHPALQFAFLFLGGIYLRSHFSLALVFLVGLCLHKKKRLLSLLICLLGFLLMQTQIPSHLEIGYRQNGIGYFQIDSVQKIRKNSYAYRGVLTRFISDKQTIEKNIPVKIRHKKKMDGNYTYLISGSLIKKTDRFYSFKPSKSGSWEKALFKPSFINQRFYFKERLKQLLSKKFTNSQARHLFISLATADVESSFLRYSFSRIGLSHILAISGFHFALIVGFFTYTLRFFFSKKSLHLILLVLSTFYLFFLGIGPSVLRAWVLVSLYLISYLIERPISSLNLLGIALLINLLIRPTDIFHLGFQFSYLSYLGIIVFFNPIDQFFSKIIPNRKITELSFSSKGAYLALIFFRKSFSLNVAVHSLITPALLFHFYKLPLYTFFYNLFIPSLIAILMYILLIALVSQANFLFVILEKATISLLKIIIYPPTICEFFLRYKGLSGSFVGYFLLVMFLIFVMKRQSLQQRSLTDTLGINK